MANAVNDLSAQELTFADLIVRAVNLEGVNAADIVPTAPLVGQGRGSLGLDSIDVLEIALRIKMDHGVQIEAKEGPEAFASLRALTEFVLARKVNLPSTSGASTG